MFPVIHSVKIKALNYDFMKILNKYIILLNVNSFYRFTLYIQCVQQC